MKKYLLWSILYLCALGGRAQQVAIKQETFEGAGTDHGYTSNTFETSTQEYFLKATVASGSTYANFPTNLGTAITNQQGTNYWVAEGVRGSTSDLGPDAGKPAGYVTMNPITNAASYKNFQVRIAFAAPRGASTYTGPGNATVNDNDRIRVQYSFDGNPFVTIGLFTGNGPTGGANDWQQDTSSPLDSISTNNGASPILNPAFQDITFALPTTAAGNSLRVRVVVDAQGGGEEVAFDNIRVTGEVNTVVRPDLSGIETPPINYTEGSSGAVQITNSLVVAYTAGTTLSSATVQIQGYAGTQDVLNFTNQNGIAGSYSAGTLTLSGSASLAAYQAALRSITYQNTNSTTATGGARVIAFTVSTGSTASNTTTRTINVTATLNPPAALPYTEDLETNGEGTRYTATTFDNATASSGFFRATASPPVGPTGVTPTNSTFSNYSGSAYWFGEGAKSGGSPTPPVSTLQLAPVNAAGYVDLRFTLRMGRGQGGQSNPWDNDDFVKLYYRTSSTGTWTLFGAFYGINATGELRRDADLNGVADAGGTSLTSALQDVIFGASGEIPNSAAVASLDFKIEQSTDVQEELAFDFIRITGVSVPTVTTAAPTSVTGTSAVLGGNVTSDGGGPVTERGVVYLAGTGTPTTSNTKDTNGSGTGAFSETIAGLTAGTTYSVRAYAINGAGTGYGATQTFTTATTVSSIVRASANPTNASSVSFTVTFANAVTGVNTSNFGLTFTGSFTTFGSVSSVSGSGTTYTVTVNTGAGDGTIKLTMPNASGISPGVSNLAFNGGETYDIDKTRPSVTISSTAGASGSTTTTSPIPFTVTFSENVNASFVQGDITVSNGTISGFTTVVAGTTFTFNVTPTTPGTATTVNVPANVAQDAAANFNTAAPSSYSITYNQPNTTVTSVTRLSPSPTATATVDYRVVFASSVTGVSTSNFTVTSTTGASVASVAGSGTTYTVRVNTGTGNGTLTLNVQNSTGISPTVTNVPYTSGEQYSIIKNFGAAPQLSLRAAGSASGTNPDVTAFVDLVQVLQSGTSTTVAGGVQNGSFETSNVAANNFLYQQNGVVAAPWTFGTQAGVSRNSSPFGSTAPAGGGDAVGLLQTANSISGSIAQNLAVPTGSYQVNFVAVQRSNNGASDQVVNVFLVEGSNTVFIGAIQPTSNTTYQPFTSAAFSVTAPALTTTISSTATSPTSTSPIPVTVMFSQSVGTTFTASDVTVGNGTLSGFGGSGTTYTFNVTPTATGLVTVNVAAGVATDANNTGNTAAPQFSIQYNQPVTAAPVVTTPANNSTTGTTPTYAGTAPAGSTVTVYVNGSSIGTTTAVGGSFSLTQPTALTQGVYTVYATAQSSGATVSANSNTNTFTVFNPAVYSSSAADQPNTQAVGAGSTNQVILRVAVTIGGGNDTPLIAQSLSFTTNGSTAPADIDAARVYYTGASSTFAATTLFGTTFTNPSGAFAITGTQQLTTGLNYFWLVYDVDANAPSGNVLDATIPSLTISGSTYNPTNPDPAGNRQIARISRVAGTALRFTGDNTAGYVDFSASTTPAPLLNTGTNGAYTQVAWIKPAIGTGSTNYYVLGNGTGNSAAPYIYVSGNGRLGAGFGTGTAVVSQQTGPNLISANEWHHVAATYTGSSLTLYLDGVAVNSGSASGTPAATRVNYIGNVAASGSNNLPGDIDEVSQWTRALSATELRQFRHLTLSGTETGLVSYLQFNDAGTTTTDGISGAVGTLTGATRVTSTAPVGAGVSNLQSVTGTGNYSFSGTNAAINFTSVSGAPYDVVVARLEGTPLGTQVSDPSLRSTHTRAYWIVDKYSTSNFTAAVTYTLDPGLISAGDATVPANLKLYKRGSNSEGAFEAPISAMAANATASTVTFPVNSFSQTFIGTYGSSPLPVELVRFTAERKGNDALLQWATAQELNNAYFEVESSVDGRTFRAIGRVTGHGTSSQSHEYTLTDANLARYARSVVYYRLRQVDQNGTSSLSAVQTVQVPNVTSALTALVFPNPAADQLTVRLSGPYGKARGWLFDTQGRTVQELSRPLATAAGPDIHLSVAHLPNGVYTLRLILDGQVIHQQLVVQH